MMQSCHGWSLEDLMLCFYVNTVTLCCYVLFLYLGSGDNNSCPDLSFTYESSLKSVKSVKSIESIILLKAIWSREIDRGG